MLRMYQWLVIGLACISVLSCSQAPSENNAAQEVSPAAEPTADDVWATVNGSPLTEAELNYSLSRFFGEQFVDARAEVKIRDSLIASRALAQKAQTELDPALLNELDVAVRAYREERLIAAYIEATSDIEPVSASMVTEYYQSHLDEFGAATITRLHIMEASLTGAAMPEAQLSKQLFQLAQAEDWSAITLPSYIKQYRASSNAQLPARLQSAIKTTPVGELSGLIVEQDKILVFRVLGEEQLPPKPLAEVSASIRKRLAATQLSKTVKALTEQIVSESDVVKHY
jgi:hypothetical protein